MRSYLLVAMSFFAAILMFAPFEPVQRITAAEDPFAGEPVCFRRLRNSAVFWRQTPTLLQDKKKARASIDFPKSGEEVKLIFPACGTVTEDRLLYGVVFNYTLDVSWPSDQVVSATASANWMLTFNVRNSMLNESAVLRVEDLLTGDQVGNDTDITFKSNGADVCPVKAKGEQVAVVRDHHHEFLQIHKVTPSETVVKGEALTIQGKSNAIINKKSYGILAPLSLDPKKPLGQGVVAKKDDDMHWAIKFETSTLDPGYYLVRIRSSGTGKNDKKAFDYRVIRIKSP